MKPILIYITTPNKKTALNIAKKLLELRLIGCGNIFKIESLYWWGDKIESGNEYALIGKTKAGYYEKIKKEVEKWHPYQTPCIIKIPIEVNKKYLNYLKNIFKK